MRINSQIVENQRRDISNKILMQVAQHTPAMDQDELVIPETWQSFENNASLQSFSNKQDNDIFSQHPYLYNEMGFMLNSTCDDYLGILGKRSWPQENDDVFLTPSYSCDSMGDDITTDSENDSTSNIFTPSSAPKKKFKRNEVSNAITRVESTGDIDEVFDIENSDNILKSSLWTDQEECLLIHIVFCFVALDLKDITIVANLCGLMRTGRSIDKKLKRLVAFKKWRTRNVTEMQNQLKSLAQVKEPLSQAQIDRIENVRSALAKENIFSTELVLILQNLE